MKKTILSIVCVVVIFVIFANSVEGKKASQESIASKLVRFHVIANSDSDKDQKLKLKVRDAVLDYISPKLKKCCNIEECRKVLHENNNNLIEIAKNIINQNGYDYNVESMLSYENFPIKTYGNITLPPGEYEAYRIIIGEGEGHNWWCVMFPPLCFVDITKSEVAYEETEKLMKNVLTNDEYNLINNMKDEKLKEMVKNEILKKELKKDLKKEQDNPKKDDKSIEINDTPVKLKFKVVEIIKNITKKAQ